MSIQQAMQIVTNVLRQQRATVDEHEAMQMALKTITANLSEGQKAKDALAAIQTAKAEK